MQREVSAYLVSASIKNRYSQLECETEIEETIMAVVSHQCSNLDVDCVCLDLISSVNLLMNLLMMVFDILLTGSDQHLLVDSVQLGCLIATT